MPQLDFYSLVHQSLFGLAFFGFFYYRIHDVFVPTFFSSLYARKSFSDTRTTEIFAFSGVLFLAHVCLLASFDDLEVGAVRFLDGAVYAHVLNSAIYAASFSAEFSDALGLEESTAE
jgi:hypothetical protein